MAEDGMYKLRALLGVGNGWDVRSPMTRLCVFAFVSGLVIRYYHGSYYYIGRLCAWLLSWILLDQSVFSPMRRAYLLEVGCSRCYAWRSNRVLNETTIVKTREPNTRAGTPFRHRALLTRIRYRHIPIHPTSSRHPSPTWQPLSPLPPAPPHHHKPPTSPPRTPTSPFRSPSTPCP